MKWRALGGLVLVIVLTAIGAYVALMSRSVDEPPVEGLLAPLPLSPLDAQYLIEDREVTLSNGSAEVPVAPDSASMVAVTVSGEPVYGDLNDDGAEDAALLLVVENGGSGTFTYVATALKDGDGFLGTNAVFLGDRVASSTLDVRHGVLVSRYVAHAEGQAMADTPTEEHTVFFSVSGATLADVSPTQPEERFLTGLLSYEAGAWQYTTCEGAGYTVATSSRSLAALEVVYAQRTQDGEHTSAFTTLVGTPQGAATTSTSSRATLDVRRIVTAPQYGVCE